MKQVGRLSGDDNGVDGGVLAGVDCGAEGGVLAGVDCDAGVSAGVDCGAEASVLAGADCVAEGGVLAGGGCAAEGGGEKVWEEILGALKWTIVLAFTTDGPDATTSSGSSFKVDGGVPLLSGAAGWDWSSKPTGG